MRKMRSLHYTFAILAVCYYSARPETIDFCLNESFNATCDGGSVILVTAAKFGRMRSGRCISGDFNVGCSKDIKPYLDSLCSAKVSCEVSVRSLVDLHPCQRDFVSYLEASYTCIEVSGLHDDSCPEDGFLSPQIREGYLARSVFPSLSASSPSSSSSHSLGTESCPWELNVEKGQKINLTLMTQDLHSPSDDSQPCTSSVVIDDLVAGRRLHVHVCSGGKRRERHLATSVGNRIRVYVTNDVSGSVKDRVILLHYAAVGCPEVRLPSNAWVQKLGDAGDSLMVRCNDSLETWYLACQSNRWLGDIGNCSRRAVQLILEATDHEKPYTFNGVLLAVMIGVVLGILIGMVLLLVLHCLRRRTLASLKRPLGGSRGLLSTTPKELDELQPINLQPRRDHHHHSKPTTDTNYTGFLTDVEMRLELASRCSCNRGGGTGGGGKGCDDYALCPFRSMYLVDDPSTPAAAGPREAPGGIPHPTEGRLSTRTPRSPPSSKAKGHYGCQATGDGVDLLKTTMAGSSLVTDGLNSGASGGLGDLDLDRTKRSVDVR